MSPAVCIGTLAWYENKWIGQLNAKQKANLKVARYLDDVLLLINSKMHNYKNIISAYKNDCYPAALSLEGGTEENNFLETTLINSGTNIECRHRNKNANLHHQEFYRGKHAWSYNEERHKMGAIIGTFTRIKRNSSTDELALLSIEEKIQELRNLNYTPMQCQKAIKYLALKHITQPLWQTCLTKITGGQLVKTANDAYH